MLEIDVVVSEGYDETTNKFVSTTQRVCLEHSLASLSKWESVFEKPFLSTETKKQDETLAYIEMMVVGDKMSSAVFLELVKTHNKEIQEYINQSMTATRISEVQKQSSARRDVITSELIYSWMVEMNIPFETQHWHLNRLITLIRVISLKRAPKKKMSAAERSALNHQRMAKLNTRG